ncbi:MAG TPA: hypothetical protein VEQ40_11230 [Pyrinomonadaceae bacterium]|nr:hypothetical protein [Pyrinomonadaceae bacterium]
MNLEDGKKRKSSERAGAQQSLRSHLFARGVVAKYRSPLGTGALDFLSEYFGERFSSAETGGLAGEKLYRKSGRDARRPMGQRRLNLSLALNVTRQILASYPSLIRLSPTRETVRLSREVLRREQQQAPYAPAKRPLVSAQRAARASRESKELLTVHEKIAREIFGKVKLETVMDRVVTPGPTAQPAPVVRYLQQGQTSISLTRHAQTLLLPQTLPALGTRLASVTKRDSITRAYVSSQSNVTLLSKTIPHRTTLLSERAERLEKRLERRFFSTVLREGRASLAASEKKVASRLLGNSSMKIIGRALTVRASLYEASVTRTGDVNATARLLNLRPALTLTGTDLTRRTSLLRAGVGGHFLRETRVGMERVLVALRQETRLELPKVARVFAPQPQRPERPVVEARNVVKHVEEKEVIETIRREVTTQMKSYRAADTFTRADFTIITDHVYDALARRLLNERERLGLNS